MTQSDVLNLLKKKKKWMSAKEINELLNFNAASTNLLKLFKQGLVYKKQGRMEGKNYKHYLFKIK